MFQMFVHSSMQTAKIAAVTYWVFDREVDDDIVLVRDLP